MRRFAWLFLMVAFSQNVLAINKPKTQQSINESSNKTTSTENNISVNSVEERIADYTGLLAIFTFVLAGVEIIQICFLTRADKTSRIAAEATSKQVDAFIATEAPAIRFANVKFVEYLEITDPERQNGRDPVLNRPVPKFLRFLIQPENIGKGTLRILRLCVQYYVGKTLPDTPFYSDVAGINVALKEGDVGPWLMQEPIFQLENEQRYQIDGSGTYLWIYGFVSYLGLFKEIRNLGFSMRWEPVSGGFFPGGPPEYTYDQKTQK